METLTRAFITQWFGERPFGVPGEDRGRMAKTSVEVHFSDGGTRETIHRLHCD